MTPPTEPRATLPTLAALDAPTRLLVRLAAVLAAGAEAEMRAALAAAHGVVSDIWIEELVLQTYLFAGFPRALNGMREWRRLSPQPAVMPDAHASAAPDVWRERGEAVCATVYGAMYDRLRQNIRALHPRFDEWMIVEGYGKVLSRPGLDLPRRELCIVAACAAADQERQLHSHLHGALNAGASPAAVDDTLLALADVIGPARADSARRLWTRVAAKDIRDS